MTSHSVYNMDGKFLLNGVDRPTTYIDTTPEAVGYIERLTGQKDFVDITLEEDGRLGVRTDEDNILLGYMDELTYSIYGDVLLQVIESGGTPRVQATSKMHGDTPSIMLHLRQDHEELVWNKFKRRPTPEQIARDAEHEAMFQRHKDAMNGIKDNQNRTQALMQYESGRKKGMAAWLLWLFLGSFGAHRYYLGDTKQGIFMTIAGLCMWLPGLLWCLIDGLNVNKRMHVLNRDLWQHLAAQHGVTVEPMPESAI